MCLSAAGRDGGVSTAANNNNSEPAATAPHVQRGGKHELRGSRFIGTPRRERGATQSGDRLHPAAAPLLVARPGKVRTVRSDL